MDWWNVWVHVLIFSAVLLPSVAKKRRGGNKQKADEVNAEVCQTKCKPKWARSRYHELVVQTEGQYVNLNCRARGVPTPVVTWYRNGRRIVTSGRRDRVRIGKWNLMISSATLNDNGFYSCFVSNRKGTISRNFTVEVERRLMAPVIVKASTNMTVHAGEKVVMLCSVKYFDTADFKWLKHYKVNGSYWDKDLVPYVRDIQVGKINNSTYLVLKSAKKKDTGWYTCLVGNARGIDHRSVWLSVRSRPKTTMFATRAGPADMEMQSTKTKPRSDQQNEYTSSSITLKDISSHYSCTVLMTLVSCCFTSNDRSWLS